MRNFSRLLFICPNYGTVGGVETVTSLLADYFRTQGLEVYILASSSSGISGEIPNKQGILMTFMKGELNSRENLDYLDNFIRNNRIDCVINQNILSDVYLRTSLHQDVVFINTLHNYPFWEVIKFRLSSLSQLLEAESRTYERLKILARFALNHIVPGLSHPSIRSYYRKQIESVSYYVVLDSIYKQMLEKRLYHGVKQDKIIVIPNPLVLPETSEVSGKKKVIWVGRLVSVQKRVDRLLRIWKRIQAEVPDWELLIIGDGPQRPELEKMARDMNLSHVRFIGNCNPEPFYNAASILCLTSSYEGFPMVLLEAQSYGVIPVSFDCTEAIAHIIEHEKSGLIIDSYDEAMYAKELLRLMKEDVLRNRMSCNAREKATEYSLEKIGKRWLELLEQHS